MEMTARDIAGRIGFTLGGGIVVAAGIALWGIDVVGRVIRRG